jgi:hypothetical protein
MVSQERLQTHRIPSATFSLFDFAPDKIVYPAFFALKEPRKLASYEVAGHTFNLNLRPEGTSEMLCSHRPVGTKLFF